MNIEVPSFFSKNWVTFSCAVDWEMSLTPFFLVFHVAWQLALNLSESD